MNRGKPKDINQYRKWLKEEHRCEISNRTRTHFDSVTNGIKLDLQKSRFWGELVKNLKEYEGQYMAKTGYNLLIGDSTPELYVKPFDSFLLKTFRKNILVNENWPNAPDEGWIFPSNWYERVNDIIRTLFTVKYLDGVDFMTNKLKSLCEQHAMGCLVLFEAREEGYYAAHLYTKQNFEIPRLTWDTKRIDVSIEIQITTQLQEVIRRLLHKYYEERRTETKGEDTKWQWEYQSDEFVANYLGHILHYVEGMIMEIREKQKEEIT